MASLVVEPLKAGFNFIIQMVKDKGSSDVLMQDLVIYVEGADSTVTGLSENGLLTKSQSSIVRRLQEATEEISAACSHYLLECSSYYRYWNASEFKEQFVALGKKLESRLLQLTASLAAGNNAKLNQVLQQTENRTATSR